MARFDTVTVEDIQEILQPFVGQYVALSVDLKNVFSGATRDEARRKAVVGGVETPIILFAKSPCRRF